MAHNLNILESSSPKVALCDLFCCNWLKASGEEDSFKIRTLFSLVSDYLLLKAELDFYLNKLKSLFTRMLSAMFYYNWSSES